MVETVLCGHVYTPCIHSYSSYADNAKLQRDLVNVEKVRTYVHIQYSMCCTHPCAHVHMYVHTYVCILYMFVFTYSETSLIRHLYNPTFSLIQPLYEVQSPYICMVRGTP